MSKKVTSEGKVCGKQAIRNWREGKGSGEQREDCSEEEVKVRVAIEEYERSKLGRKLGGGRKGLGEKFSLRRLKKLKVGEQQLNGKLGGPFVRFRIRLRTFRLGISKVPGK